jgi:hypothetical protein
MAVVVGLYVRPGIDGSRRLACLLLLGCSPPCLYSLDNNLRRLLVLALLEAHHLSQQSAGLRDGAFTRLLGLCHQCIVCLCSLCFWGSLVGDLLSLPASSHRLSVWSFNGVCILLRVDGTWQNVWHANDQEAEGECAREEGAGLARSWMEGWWHRPGMKERLANTVCQLSKCTMGRVGCWMCIFAANPRKSSLK